MDEQAIGIIEAVLLVGRMVQRRLEKFLSGGSQEARRPLAKVVPTFLDRAM